MTRTVFYSATTLDGFLADDADSLAWLMVQPQDEGGALDYQAFIENIGVLVMGATTYEWVLDHLARTGEPWSYEQPCFVFTHRELDAVNDSVTFVRGDVSDHLDAIRSAAGDRDIWMVGGGDLAAQFADAGALDELLLSIAPVTLGSGRPLFPRRYDLRLTRFDRNGAFLCAWYDVVGPGQWDDATGSTAESHS